MIKTTCNTCGGIAKKSNMAGLGCDINQHQRCTNLNCPTENPRAPKDGKPYKYALAV
ncbi:hypothetical protein SIN8267_01185 [Sinobacterium norvegicum]|uniref:Uncharacterized protein n=1 Tax=Sinobacterium norvegicum TaxID=1641715 RepID=A0ABM9ADS4_9GAMM|nr:hypothetical protein [Sinobacterium norvegicum]CAH0991084.1 hypothetical protein SIN8267_01185 [Sinobacterium norvegicum]